MLNRPTGLQLVLKEHIPLYIFVSVLFIMGVVFGALMVNALAPEQKDEMFRYFTSFVHALDQGTDFGGQASFQQAFLLHLKWMGLIWVLGLSVVGLPLILVLDFFKGVLVGFSIGYLSGQLAWKGLLFSMTAIVPQNLVIVPVLMMTSVAGLAFSLYLIKHRFLSSRGSVYREFLKYTTSAAVLTGVLGLISLFEAFVSPAMMRWVTPMLLTVS